MASCGNCKFFIKARCVRKAPTVVGEKAHWPAVSEHSWCGEHKPKQAMVKVGDVTMVGRVTKLNRSGQPIEITVDEPVDIAAIKLNPRVRSLGITVERDDNGIMREIEKLTFGLQADNGRLTDAPRSAEDIHD